MGFVDKMRDFFSLFKVPRETLTKFLSLLIIYVIGLLLRLYPYLVYGADHRAYDPFIQYKATQILLKGGLAAMLSYYDFKFWYPYGNGLSALYIMVPLLGAIIYVLFNSLGFHIDLLTATTIAPPIYGSLVIITVYFIGREIKSSNAGLIAALITAVSPGFLQRSIAAFYDNEMTIFLVLLAFLFFIRGIKHGEVISSVLSGFFFGLVLWGWGIWNYVAGMLAIYVFLRIISGTIDKNDALAYLITTFIGVGMGIMIPRNYSLIKSSIIAAMIAVALLVVMNYLAIYFSKIYGKSKIQVFKIMIGAGLIIGIIGIIALLQLGYLKSITGKFASIMNPFLREEIIAYTSVAENQPSIWANFYLGVGLGIMFLPLAILAMIERRDKVDLFLFILIITMFYFTASITRVIVLGGPILALGVGLGVEYIIEPYTRFLTGKYILHKARVVRIFFGGRRPPKGEVVAVYFTVFLLLSLTVYQGITVAKFYGGYDFSKGEKDIFKYLKEHANPHDNVLLWWDYGYRCTIMGDVTTLADNGTGNSTQMGVVGSMLMLPPNKSFYLMVKYRIKWVLVYSYDVPKAIWMIRIASKYASIYGVNESKWLNKGEMRYKKPFFYSVLWRLVVYGESQYSIQKLIESYGDSSIKSHAKDLAKTFSEMKLIYFKLIMKRSVGGRDYVKLYKVIWPKSFDSMAPFPPTLNVSKILVTYQSKK